MAIVLVTTLPTWRCTVLMETELPGSIDCHYWECGARMAAIGSQLALLNLTFQEHLRSRHSIRAELDELCRHGKQTADIEARIVQWQ